MRLKDAGYETNGNIVNQSIIGALGVHRW